MIGPRRNQRLLVLYVFTGLLTALVVLFTIFTVVNRVRLIGPSSGSAGPKA
jgi:hypothetical protein